MNLGNLITKLESLTKELNHHVDYLTTNDCEEEVIEKIGQYEQFIESQVVGTTSLSSFKYLQDWIKQHTSEKPTESIGDGFMSPPLKEQSENTEAKSTGLTSPETNPADVCLSQPMYSKRMNNTDIMPKCLFSENKDDSVKSIPSTQRTKPSYEYINMLTNCKGSMGRKSTESLKEEIKQPASKSKQKLGKRNLLMTLV